MGYMSTSVVIRFLSIYQAFFKNVLDWQRFQGGHIEIKLSRKEKPIVNVITYQLYYIMSYHITSRHITSHHVMLCNIRSRPDKSCFSVLHTILHLSSYHSRKYQKSMGILNVSIALAFDLFYLRISLNSIQTIQKLTSLTCSHVATCISASKPPSGVSMFPDIVCFFTSSYKNIQAY